jgi:DUF3035 family protein
VAIVMMRKIALLAIVGLIGLTACEGTKQSLGLGDKKAPDEFSVVTKAPLIMPPDFALRPPNPGQRSPQDIVATENAQNALFGKRGSRKTVTQAEAKSAGTSAGELALLREANAENATNDIRNVVNSETALLAEEDVTLLERAVFWQEQPEYGTVLDPAKEKKRLRENAALGDDASAGGETPTIERRKRAPLEGLFSGWFD